MSFLENVFTVFVGKQKDESNSEARLSFSTQHRGMGKFTEEELSSEISRYSFVEQNYLPPLTPEEVWWQDDYYLAARGLKKLKKSYSWTSPFLSDELIEKYGLSWVYSESPFAVIKALPKQVRALIKDSSDSEVTRDYLKILYGICLLDTFIQRLDCVKLGLRRIENEINRIKLNQIDINYQSIGYQDVTSLSKTDVKWLIKHLGEPSEHQNIEDLFYEVKRDAITRFCWVDLAHQNRYKNPPMTMSEWMNWWFGFNLSMHNGWRERVSKEDNKIRIDSVANAHEAIENVFAVADLETTGLNSGYNEIIEFAAVIAKPDGTIIKEFSQLIKPEEVIPAEITRITGITQKDVEKSGISLKDGLTQFLAVIENYPVFFHNARFDVGFINAACNQNDLEFTNIVYDSLALSRRTWSGLPSYKLSALAEMVGAPTPDHRALNDVKSTLAVILAAKNQKKIQRPKLEVIMPQHHEHHFKVSDYEAAEGGVFFGKTLVFTGALVSMTRDNAATTASKYGFAIGASVTKKTDYLVVGIQDLHHLAGHEKSSKHRKAEELMSEGLEIKIITEDDFLKMIN
jgi:DNA polymerase III subunit epsilon